MSAKAMKWAWACQTRSELTGEAKRALLWLSWKHREGSAVPVNRSQMARELGVLRGSLYRVLDILEREQFVSVEGGKVVLNLEKFGVDIEQRGGVMSRDTPMEAGATPPVSSGDTPCHVTRQKVSRQETPLKEEEKNTRASARARVGPFADLGGMGDPVPSVMTSEELGVLIGPDNIQRGVKAWRESGQKDPPNVFMSAWVVEDKICSSILRKIGRV